MLEFLAALGGFLALHVAPAATGLRDRAIARVGRGAYVAGYSALSLAALGWVVLAAGRADHVGLWDFGAFGARLGLAASLLGMVMVGAGGWRANPLSASFVGGAPNAARPGLLALTAHPVLIGFALWSAGHLLANGDLASAILFGSMLGFSLFGMRAMERRAARREGAERLAAARSARQGGWAARLARALDARLALELGFGAVVALGALLLHPWLIGVDPLAALG